MADITVRNQGNVSDEGLVNWRSGDSGIVEGDQSIYDTSTIPLAQLGQVKVVGDRVFRYGRVNATLKPAQPIGSQLYAVASTMGAADVSGGKTFTMLFNSAAASAGPSGTYPANFFAEGTLVFATGTSTQVGMSYRVKSHLIVNTNTTNTITLNLYDPLKYTVALTGTEGVRLLANPYAVGIVNTGALYCPGICVVNATTGDYTWLQTAGPCPVMITGTGTAGTVMALVSSGAQPLLSTGTAGTSVEPQILGVAIDALTTATPGSLWLCIEP